MNKILLGQRIKEARLSRGLSLDELASAVGLNKSTISRYERAEIESPKLPVIEAIGNQLHTNPAWLIGKSNDKTFTPADADFRNYGPCNLFGPIRNLRLARGLSIEDVAYNLGISTTDYLAIENGANVDCITLATVAAFFGCTVDFALSPDGVFAEDSQIEFTKNTLIRLHRPFIKLSSEDQENVITFAELLAERSEETVRLAARNGKYMEFKIPKEELEQFIETYLDKMPDVPEDL